MNTVRRNAKNTEVLPALYLGVEGFDVFSDLGLGTLTVREVARSRSLAKNILEMLLVAKVEDHIIKH